MPFNQESFVRRLIRAILEFFSVNSKPSTNKPPVTGIQNDSRDDNLPEHPSAKPETKVPDLPKMQLWYPDRLVLPEFKSLQMKTIGKYKYGHPQGAIVHFTAGRTKGTGKWSDLDIRRFFIESSCNNKKFVFFIIDNWGNVFQQFPLDRWGYHAGTSSWPSFANGVNSSFVGIEVMNAGKLKKVGNKYEAWFDETYSENEVRYVKKTSQIEEGFYHKFTEAQEQSLEKLLRWLESNGDGIFQFKNVAGHDEVSPGRKNDPGGSLSISMQELRNKLEKGS